MSALGLRTPASLTGDWRRALVAVRVALPDAPVMLPRVGQHGWRLWLDFADVGYHAWSELHLERLLRCLLCLLLHAFLVFDLLLVKFYGARDIFEVKLKTLRLTFFWVDLGLRVFRFWFSSRRASFLFLHRF